MEWLSGPTTSSGFPATRKKRSDFRRRPHPNPKPFTNCQNAFKLLSSQADYGEHGDICSYSQNKGKLKKLKLKLGVKTHTLHTKSASEIGFGGESINARSFGGDEGFGAQQKQDFSRKNDSKRVSKKHTVEGLDDDDDEEIRYLKKLKASKVASFHGDRQEESSRKTKGITKLMGLSHIDKIDYGSSGFGKDGGKTPKIYEDKDYEIELISDDELKSTRKRLTEDFADPVMRSGPKVTITTRKRALECHESGGLVEFPNGLPSPPSKKQKLSAVEQQLRKAKVAQRRKLQAQKAAMNAEAKAIRKILGQDSNRKKKEEKLKKQHEELAQEKMRKGAALGPNTIRWVVGPFGTVVTFSEDIGLPTILQALPCRYPPPREKCVGPNCTNAFKYRDSKSKLPLCSLHCYKAVQLNTELLPAY